MLFVKRILFLLCVVCTTQSLSIKTVRNNFTNEDEDQYGGDELTNWQVYSFSAKIRVLVSCIVSLDKHESPNSHFDDSEPVTAISM
jgi:hypothetical protein